MITLTKGTFTGVHNIIGAHGPLMGRLAIAGLMGQRGFLSPRGSELVKAKSSSFSRQSSPCTLRLRRLWPGATLRLVLFLLHSLHHGFRQVWSKGLMPIRQQAPHGKG
jgi:hypothetical protein